MIKFGWYKHFKGNLYFVFDVATHSETKEMMVIYKDKDEKTWTRPLSMFIELLPDRITPRFEYIDESKGMITDFRKENRWISNFEKCEIVYEGLAYGSTEAAYQSAKTNDMEIRKLFCSMTPKQAMIYGREIINIRDDWEQVKYNVMYDVNFYKFTHHEYLKEKLLATEEAMLIEGNTWGDIFWGVCDSIGENNLGKILMKIRSEIKKITI